MSDGKEPTNGDNLLDKISVKDLQSCIDLLSDKQRSISEATGQLRNELKGIIDSRKWNKRALGMIREIDNMSEATRADFLRTFHPMFLAMMEAKWDKEMQDLLADNANDDLKD